MPKSKNKNKKRKTSQNHQGAGEDLSHAEIWDDSALLRSWDDALAEYEFYHSIHARGEDVDEVLHKAELEEEQERRSMAPARAPNRTIHSNDINAGSNAGSEDGEVGTDDGETIKTSPAVANAARSSDGNMKPHFPSHLDEEDDEDRYAAQKIEAGVHGSHHGPYLPSTRSPTTEDRSRMPSIVVDLDDSPPVEVASSSIPGQGLASKALPLPSDQTLENIKMAYYWAGYYSGLYDGQQQAQREARAQTQTLERGDVPAHKEAR